MALDVFSQFFYEFKIENENRSLCISEGGPEVIVELDPGTYTLTDAALMIQKAFNEAGSLTYTVSTNRYTRSLEIEGSATWGALISSGSLGANQAWPQLGFTSTVDLAGDDTYVSDAPVVKVYRPQFWLQDYIPSSNKKRKAESTVRRTTTGEVEVVTFGDESFMKCSILFATDKPMDGKVIENNPSGVSDLRDFMSFCISKKKLEFMENRDAPNNFETMLLESTEQSRDGVEFELREMVGQNLPDFYEVKNLVFRRIG